MELEKAIELLKKAVKENGTNDQKHIDLTLIPASERAHYDKALMVSTLAIKEGKIARDEFYRRLHLD